MNRVCKAALLGAIVLSTGAAAAADPCKPALSVSRTLVLEPGQQVGSSERATPLLADHEIVLTFDDGPNPQTTPMILDLLAAACIKATFFPIGAAAAEHPDLVQREVAEGHSVGGHTFAHSNLTNLTFGDAVHQIEDGFAPLRSDGVPEALFRFPQLARTDALVAQLKKQGVAIVGVDIDPKDWIGDPPDVTLARLKSGLDSQRRGIVLLHDSQANTLALLPGLLDLLGRDGYRIVHLSSAVGGGESSVR
jgi:peptidoglycan-N-acetylglucosamine deacetylase